MISPIPFCPSFEPWANDTPVYVRINRPRIQNGGGFCALRLLAEFAVFHQRAQREQQRRATR